MSSERLTSQRASVRSSQRAGSGVKTQELIKDAGINILAG